ncbi:MAG: ATP-dependent Clp protease adapter ClpS [Brachymonas sp.]|nr:ATP-dependent Clp protease adapter ClpS [Brachymonas sp.]
MSSSTPSRPPSPATPGKPAEGTPAHDGGGAAETAVKPQLQAIKPPAMYQVVLINDDFTPMEFVVLVLQEFFNKDLNTATSIMYQVHTEGRGICGIYTRDIAQTKTHQVMEVARSAGHPLQCIFEPAPE